MLGLRWCTRAFSSCGEAQASVVVAHGLSCSVACGSSRTRARTCVPCTGRRILNHGATREAPIATSMSVKCPAQCLALSRCSLDGPFLLFWVVVGWKGRRTLSCQTDGYTPRTPPRHWSFRPEWKAWGGQKLQDSLDPLGDSRTLYNLLSHSLSYFGISWSHP